MEIRPLKLEGSFEILLNPKMDNRGYFMRSYDRHIFEKHGLQTNWVQENESLSKNQNVIRGLHFLNPPHTETKFVRVIEGKIFDVFVDLRKDSKTYGQWDSIEISAEKHNAVYIPKGFAHGFLTLSEIVIVQYKVDNFYAAEADNGIRWNDADLNIDWKVDHPIISERDRNLQFFADFDSPFTL